MKVEYRKADMKHTMNKKVYIITGILAAAFLLMNLIWFGWRHLTYSGYRNEMSKTNFSTVFHLTYPGTDEDPFNDGLIIWPKLFGGYEYGVILNPRGDDTEGYMFYIDIQGNAIDEEYGEIAENCQDVIQELLARANSRWLLKE